MFAAGHYSMSQPSYNLQLHQNLIPLDMQPSHLILQSLYVVNRMNCFVEFYNELFC